MTPPEKTTLSVSTDAPELTTSAKALANALTLPFLPLNEQQIQLVITERRIEIRAPELGNPIFIDFTAGKNAHRRQFGGGRGQPLAKAIGLKKGATPTIIDATAGFGRDAFVLANLGCQITLIERNPFIATLLKDAIERAALDDDIGEIIKRMTAINQDAIEYLSQLSSCPDVIYMDPMYPTRDKSALVKKDMRLLHTLVGPDVDSTELLKVAKQTAKNRVVVKRPKSAPFVGEQKPATSIESKNTRYDIYLCKT